MKVGGGPKKLDLLQASFQVLDTIPNTFAGLYPRKSAYTQGAEWEDFAIPRGNKTDSALPAKYKAAGFETWYIHGYDQDFFKRAKTYPTYGFDSLLFRSDFFKRGLKGCQYGYPGICDASMEQWIEHKLDEPGKNSFTGQRLMPTIHTTDKHLKNNLICARNMLYQNWLVYFGLMKKKHYKALQSS